MKKLLIVLFLTFTASFTPIAAKFAVNEISPLSLAFFRFGIATVLFLIVFKFRKLDFKVDKEDRLNFLWLGALVIPINQFCFLKGISLSLASHSGVIYAITPLLSFILSIFLNHEKYSLKKLLTISITIAGVIIIFYESIMMTKFSDSNILLGDILLFFAVFSWAAYITFSKNIVIKYGALKTSAISFSVGMIMFIPIFLFDLKNFTLDKLTPVGIIAFIHLSVIVAFAGYFVFVYASKVIPISTLTTLTNSSPIVTIIFSWLLLKEELSYFFIIGAVITMAGVFLTQKYSVKEGQKAFSNL